MPIKATVGDPGGLDPVSDSLRSTDASIAQELRRRWRSRVGDTEITACVQQATRDLSGSVSREALPEMAARLAEHRLGEIATQASGDRRSGAPDVLAAADRAFVAAGVLDP